MIRETHAMFAPVKKLHRLAMADFRYQKYEPIKKGIANIITKVMAMKDRTIPMQFLQQSENFIDWPACHAKT